MQRPDRINPKNLVIASKAAPQSPQADVVISSDGGVKLPCAPPDDQPLYPWVVDRKAMGDQSSEVGPSFRRQGDQEIIMDGTGNQQNTMLFVLRRTDGHGPRNQRAGTGGQQIEHHEDCKHRRYAPQPPE